MRAADKPPNEYKYVGLGLTFLSYISDVFDE